MLGWKSAGAASVRRPPDRRSMRGTMKDTARRPAPAAMRLRAGRLRETHRNRIANGVRKPPPSAGLLARAIYDVQAALKSLIWGPLVLLRRTLDDGPHLSDSLQ